MTDLRIGIVGTGHMAQTMAAAIGQVGGLAVGGFLSRDAQRAATIASAYAGAKPYAALEAMLADPAIGAIYVANDTAAHAQTAIAALTARKPVLCEKPCAIDSDQAARIAEAAAASGTLFMEAIATPFLPAVAAAIGAAASGRLGTPRHLTASFGYKADAASHPGCFAAVGGGVLLDRAVYAVALARLVMGRVDRLEALVTRDDAGIDVEASLLLHHEGGGASLLAASFLSQLDNSLTIAGTSGTATVAAPLLLAESLTITHAGAPTRPALRSGVRAKLGAMPLTRRLASLAQARHARRLSFGASLYAPELVHFRDLVATSASASPILPPSLSVEVMAVLDAARMMTA